MLFLEWFRYSFVLMTTFLLISCNKNKPASFTIPVNQPSVVVKKSMGEKIKDNKMALIGNVGYLIDKNSDTMEVMVISTRVEKETLIPIHPLSTLVMESKGSIKKTLIATTPEKSIQSLDIKDLTELSVQHGYLKRMIEQWYLGFGRLEDATLFRWEKPEIPLQTNENQ